MVSKLPLGRNINIITKQIQSYIKLILLLYRPMRSLLILYNVAGLLSEFEMKIILSGRCFNYS